MSATKRRNENPNQPRVKRNTRAGQSESLIDLVKLHRRIASGSASRLLQTPASSLVTLFVVAVALLLPALLFGLSSNLASLLAGFQDSAQVTLYLQDSVSEADGQKVSDDLLTRRDIESGYYVSPSQALDEFSASSGLEDLLIEMTANPLPGAIVLTPWDVSPAAVDELARELQELPQVDVVQVDSLWLQRLAAISNLVSAIGSVLAVIVILGLFFVVGNTIKLAIESRKAEILVIKLVGGSDMYAARPFLYTGLLYGLGGGILATLLQIIVLATFNSNLEVLTQLYESDFQLRGFGLMSSLLIIVAGAAIGWMAALMASLRHIRAINP
ncbi:MAG: permease-like cell division protein FtsX [Proteobacteria bacterium]|jgi:cell division transport system permease protein|nr:permease-like cell division protein FtsX [Pseudomonadota bacterium]MDA1290020.1 permease-like cell division protein FtsX [Pseudomonadota bacterium]